MHVHPRRFGTRRLRPADAASPCRRTRPASSRSPLVPIASSPCLQENTSETDVLRPTQRSTYSGVRQNAGMLELAILGFLYDTPLHGYELRKRITALTGPCAARRREHAVSRDQAAGEGRPAGARDAAGLRGRPASRPRHSPRTADASCAAGSTEPAQRDITDENRWFTVLAFLRHLDDPAAQAAVLRRRLAFLEEPASFFYEGDRPLRAEELDDPVPARHPHHRARHEPGRTGLAAGHDRLT